VLDLNDFRYSFVSSTPTAWPRRAGISRCRNRRWAIGSSSCRRRSRPPA